MKTTFTIFTAISILLGLVLDQAVYKKVNDILAYHQSVLGARNPVIEENILVKQITDGDTIILEDDSRVRLIGIDAPELKHEGLNIKQECYGAESKDYLKSLIEGKRINLEKDRTDLDRYGRKLRYIYYNSTLVNDIIVKNGYAKSYPYPPDIKYQPILDASQQLAKTNKIGMWGTCKSIK